MTTSTRWANSTHAAQQFQILLEAGDASSPLLSLAYTALGKVYYAQERLLPAAAEYESALDAFPANAEAEALWATSPCATATPQPLQPTTPPSTCCPLIAAISRPTPPPC